MSKCWANVTRATVSGGHARSGSLVSSQLQNAKSHFEQIKMHRHLKSRILWHHTAGVSVCWWCHRNSCRQHRPTHSTLNVCLEEFHSHRNKLELKYSRWSMSRFFTGYTFVCTDSSRLIASVFIHVCTLLPMYTDTYWRSRARVCD